MSGAVLHSFADRHSCAEALAEALAAILRQDLSESAQASMLLPGGSSPALLWPKLAAQALDWSAVRVSPGDERWVAADSPQSNGLALRHGLPLAQYLDPRQSDQPEQAAALWAQQLKDWLPFSAVLLGMGEDGHFASLFTQMPNLAAALDLAEPPAAVLGVAPDEPKLRLSGNLSMLLSARWVGLLVFGQSKKRLLDAALRLDKASLGLPIASLLHNPQQTVQIYWAP